MIPSPRARSNANHSSSIEDKFISDGDVCQTPWLGNCGVAKMPDRRGADPKDHLNEKSGRVHHRHHWSIGSSSRCVPTCAVRWFSGERPEAARRRHLAVGTGRLALPPPNTKSPPPHFGIALMTASPASPKAAPAPEMADPWCGVWLKISVFYEGQRRAMKAGVWRKRQELLESILSININRLKYGGRAVPQLIP
jgi:hypothetical protein